ncbi:hypothetical protein SPSYN_00982 [Sporotomaculum syntrophicum]|uniref:Uncharacterized protein n=1 Tax=Sporotomaculum syntrophicum TaxID=182264 RepID=A0A9D2WSE7_9FIRM|nr:hypothetical protein [Sporotomaculum syntrophicum]KAF1086238.1 hypothetical protein SPSYN_00982 [Sporotomaculum syntrophicum]
MKIINNQNFITNRQILDIIQLLGKEYAPHTIVLYETRLDMFKFFPRCFNFALDEFSGQLEGVYEESTDTVYIFIFVQTDDGDDVHSRQLYSLHALMHELRHRFQAVTNYLTCDDTRAEQDADQFATSFINERSRQISKIMNWPDEWTVEEER